ncbi:high frequency lysogenization protein HflD [Kitasatospora sp. NBC_01287]|uniref:HoxN/HupN/NixA family nickel/cobalt transporter n=1 Tax=Kitasatospora sp. NBC_01287 TaxID=2903573 RepID=UPI0022596151|nr:high frequency lysogenization protein HflD [Kitasatospora sp. NBC_01287]MCX4751639.1 high frequency lysogenization protein HflD [Kitasatospora sp. NBC_01287]
MLSAAALPAVTAGWLLPAPATAAPAAPAHLAAPAHPLGNFSINHYTGFTLAADRIEVLAVTDTAEIPTLQDRPKVQQHANGATDQAAQAAWAADQCAQTAQRLRVTAADDGPALAWTVDGRSFTYLPGAAGLQTSRLECRLSAPLHLDPRGTTLRVATGVEPGRVGWNEITARGDGARLTRSDVPDSSVTQELRNYPRDLLENPSGVTTARFTAVPGGDGAASALAGAASGAARPTGPNAWLASLSGQLTDLGAAHRLTLPIGLLAVLLSVVLGAGHALLPGHGKTVMAAYLAGKRGTTRDALTVGATVTATHTAGVLVMGLCLTGFAAFAGDVVLGWLGALSGALVALIGAGLLLEAVRRHRARPAAHDHDRAHDPAHHHDHPHPHPHPHSHHDHHDHDHQHSHSHGPGRHHHHRPAPDARPLSRRGLVGMGIAGGLVPSPSALVVLLGAVALGRTLFGAGLVLAYGLGMAGTLTAVGLLFVRLGDRLASAGDRPLVRWLRRLSPYSGLLTAVLVLVVGLGLLIRSLPSTL